MTDNPLTGKVGLDVTDFKTSIASMNRELRVLESGFKASAASLGDWGKSVDGLEMRQKSLTSQMDVQQKKVAALRGEYERVKATTGENSRASQELEIKLNKEVATLGKMEVELSDTEKALSEMANESKDAAKGADQLAKEEAQAVSATDRLRAALDRLKGGLKNVASDFKNLGSKVLKGVAIGIAGVGIAAAGAIVGISRFVTGTAKAADEIVENAEKIGITAEKYQEFSFIGEQVGTDVETIGRAFARTTKAISGADEEGTAMAKTLDGLGVSVRDANGDLRSTEDVFSDIITSLGSMTDETQRDIVAQQIFGKSFQELVPLINLGADGLEQMTQQAHDMGAVIGEDAVNSLADFNDKLAAMKAGFKGLMGRVMAPFLPLVTKIMDKFQEWLGSPAVQEGLKRITDGIERFATKLGEILDKLFAGDIGGALREFLPPEVVDQITNFAQIFSDFINNTLLPFVREHAVEIKGALIGIGAALAAAGIVAAIAGVAGAIASLANPVGLIIALAGLLGAAWAGNWGGIRDILTAFWVETAQPIFAQIKEWLAVNIPIAIEALKAFWVDVLLPAIQKFWAWCTGTLFPFLQDLWNWLKPKLGEALTALGVFWTDTLWPAIKKVWEWCTGTLFPFLSDLWDWLSPRLGEAIQTLSNYWTDTLWPAIKKVWAWMNDTLFPFIKDLNDFIGNVFKKSLEGFKLAWEFLKPAMEAIWSFLKDDLLPIVQEVNDFIGNVFQATIDGLKWAFDRVAAAVSVVYNWLLDMWNLLQKIKIPKDLAPGSPSPFELGLRGIADAMEELSRKQMPEFAMATGKLGGSGGGRVTNDSRRTISIYGGLYVTGVSDSESLLQELARLMP